ncbi:AAA family ATPase [Nonomuraea typhae]|uniref:AAA family ATPase n=1 Tax=Nonomuraea typhae TaxID=2603600 RepID=A0ABW7Z6J4_9ACTN
MTRRNDVPEWGDLPRRVLRALQAWQERDTVTLNHGGWFPAGRGRDLVGLVERSSDRGPLNLVAKFYRPPAGFKTDRVAAAGRTARTFPHLARPYGEPIALDDWRLVFQDVARGDLGTMRPLLEPVLDENPQAAAYCGEIVASIVRDWNSGDGVDPPRRRTVTVEDFMRAILGERMTPHGPIRRWAERMGVPGRGHPETMTRPGWGRTLPNPFRLLHHRAHSRRPLESMVTGRAHGDLSGRNILLPMDPPRPGEYVLIDLDRFDAEAPLARDPMHLLVALAMDLLAARPLDEQDRLDLVEAVADPPGPAGAAPVRRFGEISAAIHDGLVPWARGTGHGKEWREQSVLALAAAALMHLGRPFFPDRDKEWCLHLAAVATERHRILTTTGDPYAARRRTTRQATPPPGPPPDESEPMDTIRLAVLHAPDGDDFVATLTERLATLPVEIRPPASEADAVAVVLTTGLRVQDPAAGRDLPVVWLRVHPVDAPRDGRSYDFCPGAPAQWEELIGHLRWIGSPAYLIDLYERRKRTLEERFPDVMGPPRDRLDQACLLLESRIAAQALRQADRGAPAAPLAAAPAPASGGDGGLRCYGRPLPRKPLDRDIETDTLINRLASGRSAIALIGPEGYGKTAMISQLRRRLSETPAPRPVDGFVYLPARGPYPINAVTVLSAIAAVTPDRDQARRVHADVRNASVPLQQNISEVVSAIGDTRVLLVLDDVQDLVRADGTFVDRQLATALSAALQQAGRNLQLLMVTTGEVVEPGQVDALPLNHGLGRTAVWALLEEMDPDGVLDLGAHRNLEADLMALTAGHPRVLELVVALLYGDPDLTLPELVARLKRDRQTGPALVPPLLTRVLTGLDRTERRVLQALAILGRLVEPAAVDAVLARYLPGQASEPTLVELVRRRLIRKDGHRFALPREPDAERLLDGLDLGFAADRTREPRPFTRRALYALAADHYAASAPEILGEEDMIRRLAEVELRLAGGERDKALAVMSMLDASTAHERRSNPWLVQLRARVPQEDDYLDVHNLGSRAMALLNQDNAALAIGDLDRAIEICRRPQLRLRLSACDIAIQRGDAHLDDGDCAEAAQWYLYALKEARRNWQLQKGRALAGLMRCHYEHGKFRDALRVHQRAKALLQHGDARSALVLDRTLAMVYAAIGELDAAMQILDQGEHTARELGQTHLEGAFIGQHALLRLDRGQPDRARELAEKALDHGVRTNNVPLRREAATILAQAHLGKDTGTDSLRAAQAAAGHAVLLSRSNRAGVAFAVRGIVLLRLEEYDQAQIAFRDARDRAGRVRDRDRANFEAADLLGLASCGLGICCGDDERFREAEQAYADARWIVQTQTVVLRVQRLFEHLAPSLNARTRPVYAAASKRSARRR